MLGDEIDDTCKDVDTSAPETMAGGLRHIRYLVAHKLYALSSKALSLIAEGYFELEDLENSICCGIVTKIQKDEQNDCLGRKKYVIIGPDTHGYDFYSVGKIKLSADGHTYYVITAHSAKRG